MSPSSATPATTKFTTITTTHRCHVTQSGHVGLNALSLEAIEEPADVLRGSGPEAVHVQPVPEYQPERSLPRVVLAAA